MTLTAVPFSTVRNRYLPLLDQLAKLFLEMDRTYQTVAEQYGFHCSGCAENCCLTRFSHHTLLEYLFLLEGMRSLETAFRREIHRQALTVNARMKEADRRGEPFRTMCPLNQEGRCRLYAHRPMICRLHGIPHELHRPDGQIIRNPGCDAFFHQCQANGKKDYIPFDRTPFYRRMAMLENSLRIETGYTEKIKLTIAQMLATITDGVYEID